MKPTIIASAAGLAWQEAPAKSPAAPGTADERSTAFRSVQGGTEMQSGEKLLVEAYAAIWLILFGFILLTWRRQKKLDERVAALEGSLAKARAAGSAAPAGAARVSAHTDGAA